MTSITKLIPGKLYRTLGRMVFYNIPYNVDIIPARQLVRLDVPPGYILIYLETSRSYSRTTSHKFIVGDKIWWKDLPTDELIYKSKLNTFFEGPL